MSNGVSQTFTFHHAGIVVSDLDAAIDAYIEAFGYTFFQFEANEKNSSLSGSSPTFTVRFGIGQLGLSFIELIAPAAGTTAYSQHLAQHGPGLHHLGYSVADLAAARKQLEAAGNSELMKGNIHDLFDFSYYQARSLNCTIEPLQLSCDLPEFLLKRAQLYDRKSL